MISFVVLVIIFALLFGMAFASKRRFGILGLALAAGFIISELWNYEASLIIAGTGIFPKGPLSDAVVPSLLILLPAIVLCFTGYKYKSIVSRAIGSILFALFALAFLSNPIGVALPVEGLGATVYGFMSANSSLVISAGVVLAVADLFLRKSAPPPDATGKKKKK